MKPNLWVAKFFLHFFKAISYIEVVTKIIRVVRARIVTLRDVGTSKGLTRHRQGRETRTSVGGFINTRDIYSLMG